MSITNTNAVAKVAAVVAGLGLVAMSFASLAVPSAKADAASDLAAKIAALQAELAALSGGSSASVTFTRDLTIGSTGADVTALQNWLIGKGFSIPAGATGYFGSQTQSALAAYQASVMISPAAGYFGPITRAKVNGTVGTGGSGSSSSSGLQGGAGSIDGADFISSLNNEEVGEDAEDAEVAGLDIEADDGSDIEISAVALDFDYADTGGSNDLDDYATEVSIWLDGDEYARVDVDEFDDDDWTKTISLDKGAIIEAGDTGELVVAVSGAKNIDSGDIGENWNVGFDSVRFRDAQGATITDTSTDDITDGNDDTTTDAGERQFSFESFASANDTNLHITSGDDEINEQDTVIVDSSDETTDKDIFSFNVEVEGDADVNLDEIEVDFDFTGTATEINDMFSSISLEMDGDEVGSETVPAADSVTFDNLDLDLSAGDTYEFTVVADFLDLDSNTYDEGDTFTARITSTERNNWEAEDDSGEDLADGDFDGTASTDAIAVYESGITVAAVSTDSDQNDAGTIGTFSVTFDVTAFGDDQYIYNGANGASSSSAGVQYIVYKGGVATSTNVGTSSQLQKVTNVTTSGSYFKVKEGETGRFTLTVSVDPDAAALYSVELDKVRFDPDNAADSSSVEDTFYTVPDTEDVLTPTESLVAA